VRVDDGEGKKILPRALGQRQKKMVARLWQGWRTKNQLSRASIPVYRYAEVRKAIAKG
jgi:hypothetical protein